MDARHVRRARARRRALGLAAVGTAAGVLGIVSTAGAQAKPPENGDNAKVTLCHATGSWTNPYVEEEVSTNAVINQVSGKLQGHGKHEDDVIPGFTIPRQSPPNPEGLIWTFPGMNMPQGQKLLDNDCYPLDIVKTGTPTVLPGGTIEYQVAVTNVGLDSVPFAAVKVYDKYVDLIPPDVATPMKPGETRVWTGSRKVKDSLRMCGRDMKNTATVMLQKPPKRDASRRKAAMGDGPTGDKSTWTTSIICPLNVSIAKTSAQTLVQPGGAVTYLIRVTNPGPLPLPAGVDQLKVEDPTATTLSGPAVRPEYLQKGESLDWTATKAVAADTALCGTNVENTASVAVVPPPMPEDKPLTGRKVQNGGPSENWWPYTSWPETPVTAAATGIPVSGGICPVVTPSGTVTPAPTAFRPAGPALTVTKTGPTRMLAGGRVAYRVTLTNTGSANATGVTLRDQAPGVFTLVTRPTGATVSGRNVDWDLGTLVPGQSVSATVRFAARRTASGRACNVVLASATGVDQVRDRACTTIVAARRPATPVTG